MDEVATWGIRALERAAAGLRCTTAVHICYGYGIQANIDWKGSLGAEWRQYEQTFPVLAASSIDQVSLECRNSRVPMRLLGLLAGKDVLAGVIDVATDAVETPEQVAAVIEDALRFVPAERLFPCTNCGMAPMSVEVAAAKLVALGQGAALARRRLRREGAVARPVSAQRQFLVAVCRHLVAARAVGRGAAAVAVDDAGLFALHVAVDAGHPGVDLVGQQTDAQRLDVIGPGRHARFGGLQASQVMVSRVAQHTRHPIDIVFDAARDVAQRRMRSHQHHHVGEAVDHDAEIGLAARTSTGPSGAGRRRR